LPKDHPSWTTTRLVTPHSLIGSTTLDVEAIRMFARNMIRYLAYPLENVVDPVLGY
jgi:phosphoglycerate dehydrogenase-like enzyme